MCHYQTPAKWSWLNHPGNPVLDIPTCLIKGLDQEKHPAQDSVTVSRQQQPLMCNLISRELDLIWVLKKEIEGDISKGLQKKI